MPFGILPNGSLAITPNMTRHSNYLSIRHRAKPIPYGGDGVLREDGDANYGFKYVKGDEAALRAIPELAKDSALLDLALAINSHQTGLFSVGCVSGPIDDDQGHRDSGYIEFAINSKSAIADQRTTFQYSSTSIASCTLLIFPHQLRSIGSWKAQHSRNMVIRLVLLAQFLSTRATPLHAKRPHTSGLSR